MFYHFALHENSFLWNEGIAEGIGTGWLVCTTELVHEFFPFRRVNDVGNKTADTYQPHNYVVY